MKVLALEFILVDICRIQVLMNEICGTQG